MTSPKPTSIVTGTVAEVGPESVVVRAEGNDWKVPRACLPEIVRAGDRVTLCALAADTADREELAKTLLNTLLSS
ncbi:MAG: hypothetical protein Q7S23_01485 [bacterium]|nr:hypothetical protein [bacterium]